MESLPQRHENDVAIPEITPFIQLPKNTGQLYLAPADISKITLRRTPPFFRQQPVEVPDKKIFMLHKDGLQYQWTAPFDTSREAEEVARFTHEYLTDYMYREVIDGSNLLMVNENEADRTITVGIPASLAQIIQRSDYGLDRRRDFTDIHFFLDTTPLSLADRSWVYKVQGASKMQAKKIHEARLHAAELRRDQRYLTSQMFADFVRWFPDGDTSYQSGDTPLGITDQFRAYWENREENGKPYLEIPYLRYRHNDRNPSDSKALLIKNPLRTTTGKGRKQTATETYFIATDDGYYSASMDRNTPHEGTLPRFITFGSNPDTMQFMHRERYANQRVPLANLVAPRYWGANRTNESRLLFYCPTGVPQYRRTSSKPMKDPRFSGFSTEAFVFDLIKEPATIGRLQSLLTTFESEYYQTRAVIDNLRTPRY